MKISAPEKIYIDGCSSFACETNDDNIEYIRTDAFIEKANIWFNNNFVVHDEFSVMSDSFNTKEEMFDDFRKYMEGE